jgi:hypothetical protein
MSSEAIDNKQKIHVGNVADDVARQVLDALKGIRFGSVEIVIHEGRVVQIERTERSRLGKGETVQ